MPNRNKALFVAAILALALLISSLNIGSFRLFAAALTGLVAGVSLYHASFGFTAAWRHFAVERRGAGLRAQILMIMLTCAVSFPLLARGEAFGHPLHGAIASFGVSAAFGAFLFGVGMQFGGSCASGTLFTVGGGSTRMLVTLSGFILGSVVATAHMPFWWSLPALPAYSLIDHFGPVAAFALTGLVFAAIATLSIVAERTRHGVLEPPETGGSLLRGPWPKTWGALALAAVGIATLLALSWPWSVTSAFALWGAKIAQLFGVPVETWPYWSARINLLNGSVLADSTSVMNFGIMIGAFSAACLAGRFAPKWRVPAYLLVFSLVGGLLMGYGARLAYGCNIGAYLGGVISGSVHGWGWLVFGYTGSLAGLRIISRLESMLQIRA